MDRQFFPCVIAGPDAEGWYAVAIPGANVNGQGDSEASALLDAAEILQEVIDDAARDREPAPRPATDAELEAYREPYHRLGVIQAVAATVPA